MIAGVLSVGSEVVLGQVVDTNAAWLSRELAVLGFEVVEHAAVGDEQDRIAEKVKEMSNRVDVLVITGGLGPTADDLTRQVLARLSGQPLVLDDEALESIQKIFAARGLEMPDTNRVQAMIPMGATILRNRRGTAVGFLLPLGRAEVAALPGVPHEMKGMFVEELAPRLRQRSRGAVVLVRNVRTFGLPESLVGQRIAHLMGERDNPHVGTLAQDGVISVEMIARGENAERAGALLDSCEREIRSLLGEAVYGVDVPGLEFAVAEWLERLGWTLAVAESCTGGLVSGALTRVPGISRFFVEGVVTYSNGAKVRRLGVPEALIEEYGAVSAAVAQAMAEGARRTAGSDASVALTGIAGPSGGTAEKPVGLVFIATSTPAATHVSEHRFAGDRDIVRDRAAKTALNLLRLSLMKAGGQAFGQAGH